MKTYKLYVCMPTVKFSVDVVANLVRHHKNRITFFTKKDNILKIVASYPSQYTIIEKIIENK